MIFFRALLWLLFTIFCLIDIQLVNGGLRFEEKKSLLLALYSILTSILITLLIDLTAYIKYKKMTACILAFLTSFGFFYYIQTKNFLDFSVLTNHVDSLSGASGFKFFTGILYETFFAYHIFWSIFFAILITASYNYQLSIDLKTLNFFQNSKAIYALIILFILQIIIVENHIHPLGAIIKSAYYYNFPKNNFLSDIAKHKNLLKPTKVKSVFSELNKPHVFLVIIESFNSRFINKIGPGGKPYTPYINQLTKKYLYLKNYNSNSVYTSKGHFSIFCSQVPMLYETEFIALKNSYSKKCLPEYLNEFGYSSHFFQADTNLNVDNTRNFLNMHGFEKTPQLEEKCQDTDMCPIPWLDDKSFYSSFFKYIEIFKNSNTSKFFALATAQNHMPFNFLENKDRVFFRNPKNRLEKYTNSIRMSDESLKIFFENLKRSSFSQNYIVIITGDHGFPLGEHNNIHNENYAYQENFGVPLLVIDSRFDLKKSFLNIENHFFSHLNLAPTILDLAGVNTNTDFVLPSIFSENSQREPVYLVQPHGGSYQAVINWPYKYIYHQITNSEQVFNLQTDEFEKNPLKLDSNSALIKHLREAAAQIYKQQEVFITDNKKAFSPY